MDECINEIEHRSGLLFTELLTMERDGRGLRAGCKEYMRQLGEFFNGDDRGASIAFIRKSDKTTRNRLKIRETLSEVRNSVDGIKGLHGMQEKRASYNPSVETLCQKIITATDSLMQLMINGSSLKASLEQIRTVLIKLEDS